MPALQSDRKADDGSARFTRRPVVAGLIAALATCAAAGQRDVPWDGAWFGLLPSGGEMLRLRLRIDGDRVVLDNLDDANGTLRADRVEIEGGRILLHFRRLAATYRGEWRDGRISGQFEQGAPVRLDFQPTPVEPRAVLPLTQERLAVLRARGGTPALGAAAGSAAGGELVLVSGVRRAGGNDMVSVHDSWQIGSLGKALTATLVARCVETGAVSWDTTVVQALGDSVPRVRQEYRLATLRHLCSHRAGIRRDLPRGHAARLDWISDDPRADRLAVCRFALHDKPVAGLGESTIYSNIGYVVAAAMLEARMDASWEDLMRRFLFAPLGMDGAGFGAPAGPHQLAGHIPGAGGTVTPVPPQGFPGNVPAYARPAGGIYLPLRALLRFLAAHRDRVPFLAPESWDTLHTPPFGGNYAMGWVARPGWLLHAGTIGSWYAEMRIDLTRRIAGAVACNRAGSWDMPAAANEALSGAIEAMAQAPPGDR